MRTDTFYKKSEVIFIACLHPLVAQRNDDGTVKVLGKYYPGYDKSLKVNFQTGEVTDLFQIPCGKCVNCKLSYARGWSIRAMLESKLHEHNWFITLTYEDDEMTYNDEGVPTLVPDDFTKFMKRLRKHFGEGVRFYACGEYGDLSMRPHFHLLAFNLKLDDLKFYSRSFQGDFYYNSATLSRIWGHGYVVVGELTEQSASYVARYVQKKVYKNINYESLGLQKEFVRMSRRPGIAAQYLEDHLQQIYEDDCLYLRNGQIAKPPRFFDTLAEQKGVDLEEIKERRQKAAALVASYQKSMMMTADRWVQYHNDLEDSLLRQKKALKRSL